jgi:MFS family permease
VGVAVRCVPVSTVARPSTPPGDQADTRIGPRRLLAMAGFRRLLLSRFASQWGDGLFQIGLAGAVIFNPERQPDALAIAAAFTALLLPYSIVGPFAGALLDRWDRRRVLVAANLLRGVMVIVSAVAMVAGASSTTLSLLALVVIGISRFVGAGLSASLPHVVPVTNLVEANALATTLGSVVTVIGAGCGVALGAMFGTSDAGSGMTTGVAVLGSVLAAVLAGRFVAGALGPDEVTEPATAAMAVLRGFGDGARAAWRAPTVTAGFIALIAHRAAFSVSLLITVLLMRYSFTDTGLLRAGLPGLGEVAAFGAAGILLAGLTTAQVVGRLGRVRAVSIALVLGAATQAGFGLPMKLPLVLVAAFLLTYAGQVIKLCVDASVQRDIGDDVRGRVFALYDTLFNVTSVVAAAACAQFVPANGRSAAMILAATALYLVGLAGFLTVLRLRRAA